MKLYCMIFFILFFLLSPIASQSITIENIQLVKDGTDGNGEPIFTIKCSITAMGMLNQSLVFRCHIHRRNNMGYIPVPNGYTEMTATVPYETTVWTDLLFPLRTAFFAESGAVGKSPCTLGAKIIVLDASGKTLKETSGAFFNWDESFWNAVPDNTTPPQEETADTLTQKAFKLYQQKQYSAAAQTFLSAIEKGNRQPDTYYNTACCYALAGNKNMAYQYLEKAIDAGYNDIENLNKDSDLSSLSQEAAGPDGHRSRWTLLMNRLQGGGTTTHEPPVPDNTNNPPEEEPVNTQKTMGDYYEEARNRLATHPIQEWQEASHYIDPKICKTWCEIQPKGKDANGNKRYGVIFKWYTFNSDGTGVFEKTNMTLMKDNSLQQIKSEFLKETFTWGIAVTLNEDQKYLTLIRIVAADGQNFLWFYGYFENDSLGVMVYDEQNQKIGEKTMFYTERATDEEWTKNKDKIHQDLLYACKNDAEMLKFAELWVANSQLMFQRTLDSGR
ncbi:MAG: hypothetical protein AABZ60_00130 [Planctomycetota bacterium]